MSKFYVIKKSAGYAVKTLRSEEAARDYAKKCCKANNNADYLVAVYRGGMFQGI